jgi:hypothetical protein
MATPDLNSFVTLDVLLAEGSAAPLPAGNVDADHQLTGIVNLAVG